MQGRVDTNFAFAILILLAGGVIIYTWIASYACEVDLNGSVKAGVVNREIATNSNCTPHYYDGEAEVRVWKTGLEDEKGAVVQVNSEDVNKLPGADKSLDRSVMNIIDITGDLRDDLAKSSSASPITVTIKGYATSCNSDFPVASLQTVPNIF